MKIFKVIIEYDGTHFKGWQVQAKGERTVQGEIERVLALVFRKKVRVISSGRTDAGVHAKGQVAHFPLGTTMSGEELKRVLNRNLADDVVVLDLVEAPVGFHSQYSAKRKTYCYRILNREYGSALERNFMYHCSRKINVSAMKREAKSFLGKKDFKSFANVNPSHKGDTVRTIRRLDIQKKNDVITIYVEANGFLYKMVRNIVGALLEVGMGRFSEGSVKKMLKQKDRRAAGLAAPSHGLCLEKVDY